ncbi:MAG: hypothetical protein KAQ96_05790 [Thermoplasmata archaeon]|nr:hypothetical protein [Thermoplasmata archaeon]
MDDEEKVDQVGGDVESTEGEPSQAPFGADSPPPQQPYQQPYPQQPYPPPAPGYAPPPQPPQMLLSTVFWKSLWFLVLVGAILILIGQILLDVADYTDEGMIKAGRILGTVSAFLIATPMIITGIYYEGTKDLVRFGMILAGAIILAFAYF